MEKGCITEEGSHDALMKRGGGYAELFALQARYYQEKNTQKESGQEEHYQKENREEEQYA